MIERSLLKVILLASVCLPSNALANAPQNWDPETYLTGSRNMGVTLGVNVPLDGSGIELCKERARTEIARQQAEADKARLDFELVRLLKCGEAIKAGVRFHPDSPYAGICADIVVLQPPAPPQPDPKPVLKINEESNQIRSRLGQKNGQEVSRPFQFD